MDLTAYLITSCKEIVVIGSSVDLVRGSYSSLSAKHLPINVIDLEFNLASLNDYLSQLTQELARSESRYVLIALNTEKQLQVIKLLMNVSGLAPRVFIGVGGSFDMLSGKYIRAPRLIQKSGLEWLWRAFQNPGTLIPRYFRDFKFIAHWIIGGRRNRNDN